ncbi:MAG: hypothetical protein RR655_06925, partial [Raoultibacter sp.]
LTADQREALCARYKDALFVSALEKQGLDELVAHVAWSAASQDVLLEVLIPYDRGDTVSLAHERCRIITTGHTEEGTHLTMQVPAAFADAFKAFVLHAPEQSDHLAGDGAIGGIDGIHR